MTEKEATENIEKDIDHFDGWINRLVERGWPERLDRGVLRRVFEAHGANFDIEPEEKETLQETKYTNTSRAKGMQAVWGEKYSEFVGWTKEYARQAEESGSKLPKLKKIGRKNSGMIGLLGELTSYAAGDDESYRQGTFLIRVTERALNGRFRQEFGLKKKEHRLHLVVPGYNEIKYEFTGQEGDMREGELPFAPSGFPPEFPSAAWKHIKTWRS